MPPKFENPRKRTSTSEDIESAQKNIDTANGLISESGNVRDMAIEDYCNSLDLLSSGNFMRKEMPEQQDSLTQASEMYRYIREITGANTIGNALDSLQTSMVDKNIVETWVRDGLAVNPNEFNAIKIGYPELASELQRVKDAKLDEILGKK